MSGATPTWPAGAWLDAVLRENRLTCGAKLTAAATWRCGRATCRGVWPSEAHLATHTCQTDRAVREHLRTLRSLGYIAKVDGAPYGKPRRKVWELRLPPDTETGTTVPVSVETAPEKRNRGSAETGTVVPKNRNHRSGGIREEHGHEGGKIAALWKEVRKLARYARLGPKRAAKVRQLLRERLEDRDASRILKILTAAVEENRGLDPVASLWRENFDKLAERYPPPAPSPWVDPNAGARGDIGLAAWASAEGDGPVTQLVARLAADRQANGGRS